MWALCLQQVINRAQVNLCYIKLCNYDHSNYQHLIMLYGYNHVPNLKKFTRSSSLWLKKFSFLFRCDEQQIIELIEENILTGAELDLNMCTRCPFCRAGTGSSVGFSMDRVTRLLVYMYGLNLFLMVVITYSFFLR